MSKSEEIKNNIKQKRINERRVLIRKIFKTLNNIKSLN